MPKHDFFSPKAISNRMKSVGLQKLRWYCQMCQKQCRDENGFKCHMASDGHLRQMRIFAENSGRLISDFSRTFESEYLKTLSHRHGSKRVSANMVYQEYIGDKNHVHMNATCWSTLTGFCMYLGKTGKAIVDETEKGWFIQYIDRDPKVIAKQAQDANRQRAELDDEERKRRMIQAQVNAAHAKLKEKSLQHKDDDAENESSDFQIENDSSHDQGEGEEEEEEGGEVNREEGDEEPTEGKRAKLKSTTIEREKISFQLPHSSTSSSTTTSSTYSSSLEIESSSSSSSPSLALPSTSTTSSSSSSSSLSFGKKRNRLANIFEDISSSSSSSSSSTTEESSLQSETRPSTTPQINKLLHTSAVSSSSFVNPSSSSSSYSSSTSSSTSPTLRAKETEQSEESRDVSEMSLLDSVSGSRAGERMDHWLQEGIVVKILNKKLADGAFYKEKGVIRRVIDKYVGEILILPVVSSTTSTSKISKTKIRCDQDDLETVLPPLGGPVLVLNGVGRGCQGTLIAIHEENFNCSVRLENETGRSDPGKLNGKVLKYDYEDISKLHIENS